MACLNMLNNEQQQSFSPAMGPRISFSNDFGDTKKAMKQEMSSCYTGAPVSSDFEFCVPIFPINPADELFFKGKLVPLKENCNKVVTLRDELLVVDDDEYDLNIPKTSLGWWKFDKLGMRRSHIVAKKPENGGLEKIDEANKSVFLSEMFANMTGAN